MLLIWQCSTENKTVASYLQIPLKDWDGKEHRLQDYSGKIVVLDFWATWCGPCGEAAPLISQLEKEFRGQDVVFLGVNTDDGISIATIRKKANQFGMSYPSLLDAEQQLVGALDVAYQPGLIFLDSQGTVFYKQYGLKKSEIPHIKTKIKEKMD